MKSAADGGGSPRDETRSETDAREQSLHYALKMLCAYREAMRAAGQTDDYRIDGAISRLALALTYFDDEET